MLQVDGTGRVREPILSSRVCTPARTSLVSKVKESSHAPSTSKPPSLTKKDNTMLIQCNIAHLTNKNISVEEEAGKPTRLTSMTGRSTKTSFGLSPSPSKLALAV